MNLADGTDGIPDSPQGCGALSRDTLEHVAASKVDQRIRVSELTLAHIVLCRECKGAVDRLAGHRRLRAEIARAAAATLSSGSVADPTVSPSPTGADDPRATEAGIEATIPGYRLDHEIHRGGQGTVFAAEQLATRRRCAVKMLIGGRFASSAQRMRFEREVEVVAALRHPSIVTLYESGVSRRGEPWFAMEYVEGERLDEFVTRTRPSPRQLAALARRIAEAIAYAHRRGVIHRDLKPGNILIDREDCPRVLDFGLARTELGTNRLDQRSDSTQDGEFVGTFAYAAPEQLSDDPAGIDSRCDLYAFGVVMYECLTGTVPFASARSLGELVQLKSRGTVPRPSSVAPAGTRIDRDLEVIVLRLLASDPARRYDTADALAEDLARYLDGRPILAREDSRTYVLAKTLRRYWILTAMGTLLACTVLAAGIALAIAFRRADAERTRAETERQRVERAYRTFRDALESADPETGVGSSSMSVADFVSVVERQVQGELGTDPEMLAEILQTLGLIQLGFDESLRASDAIFRAYQIQSEGHGAGRVTDLQLATSLVALARLRFADEDFAGAEQAYRDALLLRMRVLGASDIETVDTERQLASALREQGKHQEAEERLNEALLHSEDFVPGRDGAIARAGILNGRAVLAAARGNDELAIAEFQATLEAITPFVAPDDFRIGRTLFSMARAELRLARGRVDGSRDDARLAAAEQRARKALDILRLRKGEAARSTRAARELVDEITQARVSGGAGG